MSKDIKQDSAAEAVAIDPFSFTADEMEVCEDELNMDFITAAKGMGGGVKLLDDDGQRVRASKVVRCFNWIAGRRANPDLTLAEAGKMPISALIPKGETEDSQKSSD